MPFTYSSLQGWKIAIIRIPFIRTLVSSKNNGSCNKLELATFTFDQQRVSVAQPEQQVEWQPPIVFVDDDCLMFKVSTPPFTSLLPVGVWIFFHAPFGLPSSCWSIENVYFTFMIPWRCFQRHILFKCSVVSYPKIKMFIGNIFNRT